MSLRARMLSLIGGSVALGLITLVAIAAYVSTGIVTKEVIAKAEFQASDSASDVQTSLQVSQRSVDLLATQILGVINSGRKNRDEVSLLLRGALESSKGALGFWLCFEKDAFDGRDKEFAGKEGYDAEGHFAPYWFYSNGKVAYEATGEYWNKDYYKLPAAQKKALLLEPYWDTAGNSKILMTSYAVPLFVGDRFVGVVGCDIDLKDLSQLAFTSSSGYMAIISQEGKYVAHPKAERLGKSFYEFDSWAVPFKAELTEGRAFHTESFSHTMNALTFRVASPVKAKGAYWATVLTLNADVVLAPVHRLQRMLMLGGLAVLIIVVAVVYVIARGVTMPIQKISEELNQGASMTASASSQVSKTSQVLAEGSSSQAASLEETSASLEELSSMTKHNAQSAAQAKEFATQARQATEGGLVDVDEMQRAMNEIKGSSDEISKIIKTIDEIAFQTNILALNAAVEAARAGDAGAGFAVVADEVRGLAQRAAAAARETADKIATAIQRTEHGVEMSTKVSVMLRGIADRIRAVDSLAAEVSNASGEQERGISQINSAVAQIDSITQSNASSAEESASAAEELNAQAEMLKHAVLELESVVRGRRGA